MNDFIIERCRGNDFVRIEIEKKNQLRKFIKLSKLNTTVHINIEFYNMYYFAMIFILNVIFLNVKTEPIPLIYI